MPVMFADWPVRSRRENEDHCSKSRHRIGVAVGRCRFAWLLCFAALMLRVPFPVARSQLTYLSAHERGRGTAYAESHERGSEHLLSCRWPGDLPGVGQEVEPLKSA